MKKIDINNLKKIQIEILNEIDSFCKEHHLNYWLDYGTLLGAVRHAGYIPWDDDIDIGMLRNDYDIFLKEFNNSNSRFKLRACEIDNDYYYPFAKVIDTNTIMYEPDENGIKGGVYVDIFVHDNVPDDDKASNKMYQKKELYNKFRIAQIFPNLYDKTSMKKRIMRFFINIYLKFFPKNYYAKKMTTNSKKYMHQETKRIGDFAAPYKIMVDKKAFKKFIPMKFEKNSYPVPIGYDEYLSEIYGDYMKLPPKEKQVSNHSFVAYYKD